MNDNVENLILAQLRDIRAKFDSIDARFDSIDARFEEVKARIDDLSDKVRANTTVVMSLAMYIGAMNERVEHIESHLGISQ